MTTPTTNALDAGAFHEFETSGGYVDLSPRPKFRLGGSDRDRFLSGQVTQTVSEVSEARTLYACITNHKGRLEGDLFISAGDDMQSFILDTDPALGESLPARLQRYIIADDVQFADISDEWRLFHLLGACPNAAPRTSSRSANRFGAPGADLWIPAASDPATALEGIPPLDLRVLEILRIANGIGAWGIELTPEILPPEARLEARAISYTKGCYIGQEVISRIRSVGRVNRTLERVDWIDGDPLSAGMTLVDSRDGEVGRLTSATFHPAHPDGPRWIALAFVKRGASAIGTRLTARSADAQEPENMLSSIVEVRNTPNRQET